MDSFITALSESLFFGMAISLLFYSLGMVVNRKIKLPFTNPLIIAILLVIVFLLIFDIDYDVYMNSAKYLSYLLTPATICLAIPLYEKLKLLRDNLWAIVLGIGAGIITSAITVWAVCLAFSLEDTIFATLLPKSITTAIGMAVSGETGGIVNITVACIMITGITGNVVADIVYKIFKIQEPVAKGIALGTASHAIGTSKAFEYGETEGAMSSLSIAVSGLLTVIAAPVFASLI